MKKGEKFEELMTERGFNRNTLSKASGVPYSTIDSMIERDFRRASIDSVILLANTLGVKVEDFIPEAAPKPDIILHPEKGPIYVEAKSTSKNSNDYIKIFEKASRDVRIKQVEYFGQVSAGERASVTCDSNSEIIELPKFIFGKYADRKDTYVMKTSGDSMDKIIPNGSYIICVPIERHELKDNDIVIYTYENESSMKRYHQKGNNIVFSPESHNKDYYDFVISTDTINDVKIEAKVIAYHVILE